MTIERTTVHIIGTDDSTATLTRYVYSNHLQSASLELDGIGDIISYEEYHPYGTTAFQAKNASINAAAKRYRYTGKERDEESGLYYHGARYYIPWLCRWTAIDPMESSRAGLSPYDYCSNNPINKTDPSGMIDGWVDVGDGTNKVVYNSNVTTQEGAQAVYGSNATYYGEYKAPYVGVGGSTYELFENGNYLKDGVSHTATDKASIRDLGFSFTKAAIFTIVGAANFLSSAKPKELLLTTTNSTLQTAALMGSNDASDAYQLLNYPGSYTAHGIVPWGNTWEGTNSLNALNKTQSDLFNKMKTWDRAQWAYESGAFTASVAMSYAIGRLTSPMGAGARTTTSNSLESGMFRRNTNLGALSELEVPMQMKIVKRAAKQAGIGLDGVKLSIVRDPQLIGRDLFGFAHKNRITLYPDAFSNFETLVKTIGHERTHIFQFKLYGAPKSSVMGEVFESAAYGIENTFWQHYLKNKK